MLAAKRTSLQHQNWDYREPGAKKAFLLSLAAHSLLALMLTVGLNWRTSSTPAGVEVELWDAPVPMRQEVPEVEPEKHSPSVDEKAEIVTQKKKEQPKPEKPKLEKKPATPPLTFKPIDKPIDKPKPKVEPPKVDPPKVKESPKTKPVTDSAKEQKEAKAKADAEKDRFDRIEKLRAQAGTEGGSGGTVGSGVGTGGTDAPGFADKVRKFIKPKITFNPANVVGNPAVTIQVELAPDGRIINQLLVKSSGVSDWDNAVLRALELAGSLPKDDNGSVPRQIRLIFRPTD